LGARDKHDGYRLIARRDGAGIRLLTRNGHDFSERYPAVVAAVNRLRCRSCVIDGEVAICNEHGLAIFERLQSGPRVKHNAVLLAFDVIELNGQDLKREPLLTRKATLLSLLKSAPAGVQYVEHIEGDGAMIYPHACKLGCEGIVSKRAGSPYRTGRSRTMHQALICVAAFDLVARSRIRKSKTFDLNVIVLRPVRRMIMCATGSAPFVAG
jgi:bifunctional non-homologous end joining protein LigD